MIFINGHPYKSYDIGPGLTVSTNVSDGRNALGEFVGQRIGRDQDKIDGLAWTMLMQQSGMRYCRSSTSLWWL